MQKVNWREKKVNIKKDSKKTGKKKETGREKVI